MNDWDSTSRFSRKFQDRCLVVKIVIWGYSGLRNLISSMKIRWGCALMVYTFIFFKMSTSALAPESAYVRVFKYQELIFDYENSCRSRIEGLKVDFWKIINLFAWSCDCKFGGHSISGIQWARKFIRIGHWAPARRLCKNINLSTN